MSASVKAGKAPDKYWRAQLAPLPPQGRSQALAAGLRQPPLEAGVRARQADKAPPSEAGGREGEAVVVGGEPAYPKCYFY